MLKKISYIFLFNLIIISCNKEEVATDQSTFIRFYGIGAQNEGADLWQFENEDFLIFGTCQAENSKDLFLTKTDKYGNEKWKANYGSSKLDERAYCMKHLDQGGFVLLGTIDTINSAKDPITNVYISKTNGEDNNGLEWFTVFRTDTISMVGYDLQVMSSGELVIAGVANGSNGSKSFIAFLSAEGNNQRIVFGDPYIEPRKIIELDNKFVLAGTDYGKKATNIDGLTNLTTFYAEKNGKSFTTEIIGNFSENASGKDLKMLADGSFIFLGDDGNKKVVLSKLLIDPSITGDVITTMYSKTYTEDASNNYQPSCMELISNNEIAISGTINSNDIFVISADTACKFLTKKIYQSNGNQSCSRIIKTKDNRLALLGSNEYSGSKVIMLMKVNSK